MPKPSFRSPTGNRQCGSFTRNKNGTYRFCDSQRGIRTMPRLLDGVPRQLPFDLRAVSSANGQATQRIYYRMKALGTNYLLVHSAAGWISAAGGLPASLRPLPASRLMTFTVIS